MTARPPDPIAADAAATLVRVAEVAIARGLLRGRSVPPDAEARRGRLELRGASFVTLHRDEQLLGCIGTLRPWRPLADDVAANAYAAAFEDPRLPAVTVDDFRYLDLTVSVVGPLSEIRPDGPTALAAALEPGSDGLLVEAPGRRGTFLPAVWDEAPDPEAFLALLWRKAGLAPGDWPRDLRCWTYRVVEFRGSGPRPWA